MIHGLAICAGGYGLEAGLHIVMPGQYRTVCAVERQAYPVACMVSAMGKKALEAFPVWDDITTFDPDPWRGLVHIVTAGYPCQPFSFAGKRLGESDPRHLWPHVRRVVRGTMPAIVFFENVAAHLTNGFPAVRNDLENIGYRVAAGIYSAAEVGAPHLRKRLFILGCLSDSRSGTVQTGPERSERQEGANPGGRGAGTKLADCDRERESQSQRNIPEGWGWAGDGGGGGHELGNAIGTRLQGKGDGRPVDDRYFAWPWPAGRGKEQYSWESPRIIKSGMGGTTHGVGVRNEQLHMLGNGVVPVVAAMAFVDLWRKMSG